MPLNVQLQLESLDGRWLPDATPTSTPPPLAVTTTQVPPELALNQQYIIAIQTLNEALAEVNQLCWDYAQYYNSAEETHADLEGIEAEIARRMEANEPLGGLPVERAVMAAQWRGFQTVMANKAAAYPPLVAAIDAQVAAINAAYPALNVTVSIPKLDAYIDIASTGDLPNTPTPGVG